MLQEPYGPPVEQIDTQEALRPYVWEAVQHRGQRIRALA